MNMHDTLWMQDFFLLIIAYSYIKIYYLSQEKKINFGNFCALNFY